MSRKSTRREFLTGKAVSDAVSGAVQRERSDAKAAADESAPETYLVRVSRQAMACEFQAVLNAGQYANGVEAALSALDLVETLEEQLSFFRPSSEISRINRTAFVRPCEVEPRLFELLQLALQVQEETGGAQDITATPLWEVWGFSRRAGRLPTEGELAEARQYVGGNLVELDAEHRTVRLKELGVRLSLGSIGKGYALDRCAEAMADAGIGDYLFHGGQSSVLARGTRAGTPAAADGGVGGWSVAIPHPLRPERQLAEIQLRNRALATSGTGVQFFRHKGRRYGHILDPRTGWPVEGVLLATVLAPTAALADVLSTAFFVMGPAATREYCRTRPEIAAILLSALPSGTDVEMTTIGLQEGDLRIDVDQLRISSE